MGFTILILKKIEMNVFSILNYWKNIKFTLLLKSKNLKTFFNNTNNDNEIISIPIFFLKNKLI